MIGWSMTNWACLESVCFAGVGRVRVFQGAQWAKGFVFAMVGRAVEWLVTEANG